MDCSIRKYLLCVLLKDALFNGDVKSGIFSELHFCLVIPKFHHFGSLWHTFLLFRCIVPFFPFPLSFSFPFFPTLPFSFFFPFHGRFEHYSYLSCGVATTPFDVFEPWIQMWSQIKSDICFYLPPYYGSSFIRFSWRLYLTPSIGRRNCNDFNF